MASSGGGRPPGGGPDPDALDELVAAAWSHHARQRPGSAPAPGEREAAILRTACAVLVTCAVETRAEALPLSYLDQAHSALGGLRAEDPAEAWICHLWLGLGAAEGARDTTDELASRLSQQLWAPFRAFGYRALAASGRRRKLAEVLPHGGSRTLVDADAWLEATMAGEFSMPVSAGREPEAAPWPLALHVQWFALLAAEAVVAFGENPERVEAELAALAGLAAASCPHTYAEAETQRLGARAAAALARARLAGGNDGEDALASLGGRLLPAWEQEYLRGLGRWQCGDDYGAAAYLDAALRGNPSQSAVRLALAGLMAPSAPDEALTTLRDAEPTREVLTACAALLARLGHHLEAEGALAQAEDAASEPARYAWPRARRQWRRRSRALMAGLAEGRGDFSAAERAWRGGPAGAQDRALPQTRSLFAARRELDGLPATPGWRRGLLEQRLERGRHETSARPLESNALFFRAFAMSGADGEHAGNDLRALLRRRAWVEAEQRVGGGRLLVVGDVLLRLGQVEEAIHAYQLVARGRAGEAEERLAVALVYRELRRQTGPAGIARATESALAIAPGSPWFWLVAAVGMIARGGAEQAHALVDAAAAHGAPLEVCQCLRLALAALTGKTTEASGDLPRVRIAGTAAAVVRFLGHRDSDGKRIGALVRDLGEEWIAQCPIDPRRAVRRLLTFLCDERTWEEALRHADRLERSGEAWGAELAALTRLRHALDRATRGELVEAERELSALEAANAAARD